MTDKNDIGYAWNFLADLGNGRQFSINGNFPKGASAEDMNKEIDKVRGAVDRQQAKSAARAVEDEIAQLELRQDSAREDFVRITAAADAKGGMSSAERQQKEASVVHLSKMDKDIKFKKGVLNKLLDEAK